MVGVVDGRHRCGQVEVLTGTDFACRELAPQLSHLTYRLAHGDRTTWRSSLWRRVDDSDDAWQVAFHQGTVVQPD